MIKFEHTEVVGWEAAIRGMRNPKNSWEKSDSKFNNCDNTDCSECKCDHDRGCGYMKHVYDVVPILGPEDMKLMKKLRNAGTDHRKFMRMIIVYVDITAPLYWWKEFDTYKVGTVANSCSTMHKIMAKPFEMSDFSTERMRITAKIGFENMLEYLNLERNIYIGKEGEEFKNDPEAWNTVIQLLPSSYNQKRTVMLNYEVLANIYKSRKGHKLDEWSTGFMEWIHTLPYSELITGEEL